MDDTRSLVATDRRDGLARLQGAVRDAAVALRPSGSAHSTWYALDAQKLSLAFRPDTPYEAWYEETVGLLEMARSIQWLVGDALAFGEDRFPDLYSQVFDPTQYRYDSVSKMARTSKAIEPSRRRPGVGYQVHAEVATLPEASQEALLDHAEEHPTTSAEMRAMVRQEKHRLERERAALLPAPILTVEGITLEVGDATDLPLPDGSVDCIITSPPYGLDSTSTRKYRVADEAVAWLMLMQAFVAEAYRVLSDGGRLLVNVPLDVTTGGYRPTYAELVQVARGAGFAYRSSIIWIDSQLGKSTARGSVDSPGAINVVTPAEMVLVAFKGDTWARPPGPGSLGHEDWVYLTNGLWPLSGEGQGWEGFEAAYPLELPRRLLNLFTFTDDLVLDPFLGSGTTAVACYELGRRCLGYDIDPLQVASASRRLALVSRGR